MLQNTPKKFQTIFSLLTNLITHLRNQRINNQAKSFKRVNDRLQTFFIHSPSHLFFSPNLLHFGKYFVRKSDTIHFKSTALQNKKNQRKNQQKKRIRSSFSSSPRYSPSYLISSSSKKKKLAHHQVNKIILKISSLFSSFFPSILFLFKKNALPQNHMHNMSIHTFKRKKHLST